MTIPGYRPLRQHPHAVLTAINAIVEKLLRHRDAIPPELYIKLDTYYADLSAAIEDTAPPRHLRATGKMQAP